MKRLQAFVSDSQTRFHGAPVVLTASQGLFDRGEGPLLGKQRAKLSGPIQLWQFLFYLRMYLGGRKVGCEVGGGLLKIRKYLRTTA